MRVVSGIQPTGELHLGNLLGAILRWVRMQDEAECLFFLADLHALTVDVDPAQLRANVREMAAALIASGIDPAKSILFAQSAVPAHAELAWILQGTARMGWLNRMTQFKDKAGKNREGASVGLFTYPVLQAADVLLYQATHVPVGEDQKQHIELARDIALKFNTDFDVELFTAPEPFIGGGTAARVMSLRDGAAKMSKSDPSDMSRINLTDSDDDDRAEDPQGEDRSRAACPTIPRCSTARPEAQQPRRHLRRADRRERRRGARAVRRPGLRRVQAGAGRRAGRAARAAARAARRAAPRRGRRSTASSPPAPNAAARAGRADARRAPIARSACALNSRSTRTLHRLFSTVRAISARHYQIFPRFEG